MRHRLTWTTLGRQPIIDAGCAGFLCRFLRALAFEERARILLLGIVSTHVHLLIATHPTTNLPRLIQRLKGASARTATIERHSGASTPLRWAPGYNIQSVSQSHLEATRDYLRSQPLHHLGEAIPGWHGDTLVEEWRDPLQRKPFRASDAEQGL